MIFDLCIYALTIEPWLTELKILLERRIHEVRIVDFTHIILALQMGIILSLVILGYTIYRVIKIQEFRIISWGLFFNFLYIALNYFVIKVPGLIQNPILTSIITGLDLMTIFCFIFSLRQSKNFFLLETLTNLPIINRIKIVRQIRYVPNSVVLFIFIIIGFIKTIPDFGLVDYSQFIYSIPVSFLNFSVIYALAVFFRSIDSEETNTKLLFIATLAYAIIQPLLVLWVFSSQYFGESMIGLIGFSFGLFCKIFMLIGLLVLVKNRISIIDILKQKQTEIERINEVKELSAKIELLNRFEEILLSTFHELNLPIISLGNSIEELNNSESVSPRVERRERVSQDYENVLATFMDFKQAYDKRNSFEEDIKIELLSKEISIYSLNFLIKTALRLSKSTDWEFKYTITPVFGGRCSIECSQYEVVLIFVNLIKNALEEYQKKNSEEILEKIKPSKKVIYIRTFNSKDNNIAETKSIIAEVEDYATGIRPEIKNEIWRRGFTTKELNERRTSGGHGLANVKEIIDKNDGWSIEVESPIAKNDGFIHGTKFILKFPKA